MSAAETPARAPGASGSGLGPLSLAENIEHPVGEGGYAFSLRADAATSGPSRQSLIRAAFRRVQPDRAVNPAVMTVRVGGVRITRHYRMVLQLSNLFAELSLRSRRLVQERERARGFSPA